MNTSFRRAGSAEATATFGSVKPAPFAYADPESLDGVLELLAGDRDAVVIAGGQSLVPLLNLRLARPDLVVDPRRVPGLGGIEWQGDVVRIGALTTAAELAADRRLATEIPGLVDAVRCIGHPPIRTRTTIGGSVAHADPVAELPAALVGLGATIELASRRRGTRSVRASSFFEGPFMTARQPDELVTAVDVPIPTGWTGWIEHARRPGDFALVGVFASITTTAANGGRDDRPTVIAELALAVAGLDGAPTVVGGLDDLLVGRPLDDAAIATAAAAVGARPVPADDLHGSGAYRVALAAELTARLLERATP